MRTATEAVVLAVARKARREGADLLAITAPPTWTGPERLAGDDGPVRVVGCVSALAVRELRSTCPPRDGEVVVILTDRDERDLGDEVVAALWRREVLRPSGWVAIRHLFRVDEDGLDPNLADADHRWLVDVLVDAAPAGGYPPPASGMLDVDTAWRTLLRHVLGIGHERPSVADLVRWAARDGSGAVLGLISEAHRAPLCARIAGEVGKPAGDLLRLAIAGRNADVVPFGLVCGALWGEGVDQQLAVTARARFEGPLGSRGLDHGGARAWAGAAEQAVREALDAGDELAVGWTARAEAVLASLDAGALAVASPVLRSGFTQRMERAGHALLAALDHPSAETLDHLEQAVAAVRAHLRAGDLGAGRVDALEMALRLTRRAARAAGTQPPAGMPVDLADAARRYLAEGSWVDRARITMSGEGETVPPLAGGYRRLAGMCAAERADGDRAFAGLLAAWSVVTPTGADRLLPIERVLDQVVVPLARRAPVLLLVVDGLSYAAAHHLVEDITTRGWTALRPAGSAWAPVVAALPTVTVHSRASLLTGRLASGGQDIEREGFAAHAGLRHAAGGQAPQLFHKRDLRDDAIPQVHGVVLDTSQRVVGIVVNSIDDHLAKGDQLRLSDGLTGIKPLGPLLDIAAEAGRIVVVTSDHGHVLELGSRVRPTRDGGERWRPAAAGPPAAGEVEVAGPRILVEGGRIVAAADESVRYNPERKYGYHGGATPQEVLCPLAVFAPGAQPIDGYEPARLERPDWWDAGAVLDRSHIPPPRSSTAPAVDKTGNLVLFADPAQVPTAAGPAVASEGWIAQLLASPVLAQQRRLAGRAALDDRRLVDLLSLLATYGGVVTAPTLERATGLPPARLRTTVDALRRLLNVDAYEVVTVDSDGTVHLNRELLLVQFGLR